MYNQLRATTSLLKRFVQGDALGEIERQRLARLGVSCLSDELVAMTQAVHPDLCPAGQLGGAQHLRDKLDEVVNSDERAMLVAIGLLQ